MRHFRSGTLVDEHAMVISNEELAIVLQLLELHIPTCEIWAFGSRVKGGARRFSDLDLAVHGVDAAHEGNLVDLAEALAESDLPFRVDLVNWNRTREDFRRIIEEHHLILREAVKEETS